jgi:hypothetical protein
MERRAITCPVTAHLETVDYERTSLGVIVEGCTRFPSGNIECPCECARRIDRRDRANNDDPTERVLVVYAHDREPAEVIAHALRVDDFTVELADACVVGVPPPEDYEAVVLVVHRGWFHHAHALETYVREHETALRARPTGTFMVPHAPDHTIESHARAFVRSFADVIPAAESNPSV